MKLLRDESLPRSLKRELPGNEAFTVPEMGWAGKTNGELLRLIANTFDVFITADQNLEYQQNLKTADTPIVVLCAHSNRLDDLRPLIPDLRDCLHGTLLPGRVTQISR